MRKGNALPIVVMILSVFAALVVLRLALISTDTWPFHKGKTCCVNRTNTANVSNTNGSVNANTANQNTNSSVAASDWKTYTSTEGQITFQYPNTWATWGKEETTKYTGTKEYYPPSGQYITRTGKHLQAASGGTSNSPEHFYVGESNDFTHGGDGACTSTYRCWAPLTSAVITKACTDKKYTGTSFAGCSTVDGAQALSIIVSDGDEANYYLLTFFNKSYNGYDRWVVGEQLQASSATPTTSIESGLLTNIATNPHKKTIDTLLATWQATNAVTGWKTYTNDHLVRVRYPNIYSLSKNGETNRRGSYESQDIITSSTSPYLKEIQFFSRDSIDVFNKACTNSNTMCFEGDYPTVARYDGFLAALNNKQAYQSYVYMTIGGRGYLVKNMRVVGDQGSIREYNSFVGTTLVSIWGYETDETGDAALDAAVENITLSYAGF